MRATALAMALTIVMPLTAHAVERFNFDTAPGRLPKDVIPIDYQVEITPDVAQLRVAGHERVLLRFRAPTATLKFNSLNQTLSKVRLDGHAVASVATDDVQQLTVVTLALPAGKGKHVLTFDFQGRIEKQPIGIFAQDYTDTQGKPQVLLSTHMESTNARRLFPCWDEPAFRATFLLTATVPAAWATVGNMPIAARSVHGELATTRFVRTPKMPSYLIEFTAGDLAAISGRVGATALGIWAPRGQEQDGRIALANAALILADYNDYFGYGFPLPKLDAIAIPGGFSGAMENWGAITYTQRALLLNSATTEADRQTVFNIQAHEMAHQWNGDLVTMGWWDDIWLNESFASFMAARETALRHPDWHWWLGQDANKESAMNADARSGAHAIQQHVSDELQAENAFDPAITYRKGQALLRMFESQLGAEVFRRGIRDFMRAHAYSNATTADLWVALSAAGGGDVTAMAAGWTEQPGFPLLSIAAHCDAGGARSIAVTQQRFMASGGEPGDAQWQVPLQLRSGTGAANSVLLAPGKTELPAGRCEEPLSLNADALGYYRVHYDEATMASNTRHFAQLPDGDRVALLDDQWALAKSGAVPLSSYLALVEALGKEPLPRAWQQVSAALEALETDARQSPLHDALVAYSRSLLRPVFEQLGWDAKDNETADVRRLRRGIIIDLGTWGDAEVLAEAQRRFALFSQHHDAVAADDQAMVLALVSASANAATFAQLHDLARGTHDAVELPRYLTALMVAGDPRLAAAAADIAVSDEVPPQFGALRLRFIEALAQRHPQLAWQALTTHVDTVMGPRAPYGPLTIAQDIPEEFWSGIPIEQIEGWVRSQVPESMDMQIGRGLEGARLRLAERARMLPQLGELLQ